MRLAISTAFLIGLSVSAAAQQQPDPAAQPFAAGPALGTTPNVRVYGSFRFAESCSYDEARDLYVTPNAGMPQNVVENDGYVSLINPDGTVHTLKWIGVDRNGLTLNHPLGSDITGGLLYLADINAVRWFDLETGAPAGMVEVEGATAFNDIEVDTDGTIFASQTGSADGTVPTRLYRIDPDGTASVLVEGAPLARANGVAFDTDGNVVVVNIESDEILTFDRAGALLKTERSLDTGNDGLVILPDGTKYISSVRQGTLARIAPGGGAPELVASGVTNAASICHDSRRNVIVAPMNNNNAIAIIDLE